VSATQWLLVLLAAGLGAGHILSERRGPRWLDYVLKPAPIACLVVLVFIAGNAPPLYRYLLVGALLFSALGDVLLLDKARFAAGLTAFLVGHLIYIAAFSTQIEAAPQLMRLAPLVAWGGIAFWFLRPGLGALATPVLVYISVLMVMIWTAAEFAALSGAHHARLAAAGALVFGISDTALATARFRRPFAAAEPVILSTYYAAQILIASSAAVYIGQSG